MKKPKWRDLMPKRPAKSIACPHCGEMAKPPSPLFCCEACGGLVNAKRPKDDRELPEPGFRVRRAEDGKAGRKVAADLVVSRRWRAALKRGPFWMFPLMLTALLAAMSGSAVSDVIAGEWGQVAFAAFFIPLVGSMAYIAIAMQINRTKLLIDPDSITVTSGPLRWPGDRTIARDDIAELTVAERADKQLDHKNIHELRAVLRDGQSVTLMGYRTESALLERIASMVAEVMPLGDSESPHVLALHRKPAVPVADERRQAG